ncbi:MAG: electron transport complex subunit RsxE, partial [Gammaproteobacteria bacterium]|nr:electron transport complex subunit RsxE [Gammaproteobacteria bacterium]
MASTDILIETDKKRSFIKEYAAIARDGLWDNNAVFAQMLGLCPLLAVSNTVINALGLGIATIMVL